MKTNVLLALIGVLTLCACFKPTTPTTADQAPVVPAAVPTEDSANPVPQALPQSIGVLDEGGNIPGVEMINSAIGDFAAANGRAPKSLNELVVANYLQKVPPAPSGKKYDIDPVRRQVRLVNQ